MLSRLHCIVSRAHPSLIFCYTLTFFPWKTFSFFLNNQLVLLQLSFPLPFFFFLSRQIPHKSVLLLFFVSTGGKLGGKLLGFTHFSVLSKVIYTKYTKHWPYTVAHTIDCVCNKMVNHGLNHELFLSLFKLITCPIYWIVYVLAY